MNTVERIKKICKQRKIPMYLLEKECGFANGYIGQLKKGTLPDDRLRIVAEYLKVSAEELSTGEKPEIPVFDAEHLELIELYSKLKTEQKEAIINLIHSMIM